MLPKKNNQLLLSKLVNNISGRKKSPNAKLKARNQQERLTLWRNHFQNLLGKTPSVQNQPIEQIIDEELDIKTGDFSIQELEAVL